MPQISEFIIHVPHLHITWKLGPGFFFWSETELEKFKDNLIKVVEEHVKGEVTITEIHC